MCGGENEEFLLRCRYCGEDFLERPVDYRWRDRDDDAVEELIPAGFFRRAWAMILDFFLLLILAIPVAFLFSSFVNDEELIMRFIIFVIAWPYYALFESSSWRGTPGKKVFGMIVTDRNGERISFARASGRYFGKILSRLICYAGYFMAAFTAEKQALHDLMSGCFVIKNSPIRNVDTQRQNGR